MVVINSKCNRNIWYIKMRHYLLFHISNEPTFFNITQYIILILKAFCVTIFFCFVQSKILINVIRTKSTSKRKQKLIGKVIKSSKQSSKQYLLYTIPFMTYYTIWIELEYWKLSLKGRTFGTKNWQKNKLALSNYHQDWINSKLYTPRTRPTKC